MSELSSCSCHTSCLNLYLFTIFMGRTGCNLGVSTSLYDPTLCCFISSGWPWESPPWFQPPIWSPSIASTHSDQTDLPRKRLALCPSLAQESTVTPSWIEAYALILLISLWPPHQPNSCTHSPYSNLFLLSTMFDKC